MDENDGASAAELEATVAARRGARPGRAATESEPSRTGPSHHEEAVDRALRAEETARLRTFSRIVMIMAALVAVQLPLLGGDPASLLVAGCGLAAMFALSAWGYLQSTRREIAPVSVLRVQGWGLATCLLPLEYYAGFFSPMTVVLGLGIYHMAQSADRPQAGLVPLYVIVTWMLGALLTAFGVLPDQGMMRIAELSLQSRMFLVSGVTATLLASLWLSRRARRSVRQAMLEANRAVLAVQKRDAVLQEAQNQLDHALRLMVGKPGRHTGTRAGAYQLGEVIGLGAMGEVYAARRVSDGEPAAVKLLHEHVRGQPDIVARFLREAELSLRFDHPNVVRVHDVGCLASGAPFMAMERLQGATLSDVLRERGQLSMSEVIELGDAIGAGLAHAYAKGVVHRDLKPHNVIATSNGASGGVRWTILDFGISKPLDSTGTLTGSEGVVGTPSYMSPEQARGLPLDLRSDLFSLASVLYRALTGRPAFPGRDTPAIMFDVVYSMPAQPSNQLDGIAPDVDLVLATGLAKEPARRFASAAELMTALRAAAQGKLDEAQRARGRAVLAERPWGSRPDSSVAHG